MIGLRKRRWLRFSTRTLLIAVTIFCVWLGWQVSIVRERRQLLVDLKKAGGQVIPLAGDVPDSDVASTDEWKNGPGLFRRWLGDEPYSVILLPQARTKQEMRSVGQPYRDAFPESWVGWFAMKEDRSFDDLDKWEQSSEDVIRLPPTRHTQSDEAAPQSQQSR